MTGSEGTPLPSMLVAKTVTVMSVEGGQDEEDILNK